MRHAKTTRSRQDAWREPEQRATTIMHTWHADSVGRLVTLEAEQATRLGGKRHGQSCILWVPSKNVPARCIHRMHPHRGSHLLESGIPDARFIGSNLRAVRQTLREKRPDRGKFPALRGHSFSPICALFQDPVFISEPCTRNLGAYDKYRFLQKRSI